MHLPFEPVVDEIVNRCNGLVIGLEHAKHSLPGGIKPTVINGLVISIFRDRFSVCDSAFKRCIHRIKILLNF